MSDPNNKCWPWSIVGAALKEAQITELSKSDNLTRSMLGIELPFGWCLIKGQRLRRLQKELHEAQQDAELRLRMCANLRRELLRKETR